MALTKVRAGGFAANAARDYIGGLVISNDGTDADHDLVIAAGVARDYSDSTILELTSSITKKIDASWTVGTNQGGLDTGSVAASSLYGIYLIKRSDTGVVDVLISLDTTPNLATGTKPLCEARLQGRAVASGHSGGYGRTLDVRTKGSTKTANEEFAIIGFNGEGSTTGVGADAQHGYLSVLVNSDKQIEYCAREHNGTTTAKLGVLSVNMLTRSNP